MATKRITHRRRRPHRRAHRHSPRRKSQHRRQGSKWWNPYAQTAGAEPESAGSSSDIMGLGSLFGTGNEATENQEESTNMDISEQLDDVQVIQNMIVQIKQTADKDKETQAEIDIQLTRLKQELDSVVTDHTNVNKRIEELTAELMAAQGNNLALQQQLNLAQTRAETLKEQENTLRQQISGLKEPLQQAKNAVDQTFTKNEQIVSALKGIKRQRSDDSDTAPEGSGAMALVEQSNERGLKRKKDEGEPENDVRSDEAENEVFQGTNQLRQSSRTSKPPDRLTFGGSRRRLTHRKPRRQSHRRATNRRYRRR